MEVGNIQWSQYDSSWWLSEPSFYCYWEFQSMSDIWRLWFGRLIWPFLQFVSGLRDTGLLQLLHTRLSKNQNLIVKKIDDVHEDVKKILAKTKRSATLPPSDTVVQQIPLKPAVFHGRDVIIEEITQLLIKEETSRVSILGAGDRKSVV